MGNGLVSTYTRADIGIHEAIKFFYFIFNPLISILSHVFFFVVIHPDLLRAIHSLVLILISHSLPVYHEWLFQ